MLSMSRICCTGYFRIVSRKNISRRPCDSYHPAGAEWQGLKRKLAAVHNATSNAMQKDFILREIEKIVYSITRLAGFKNAMNPEAFIQQADQMLQDEFDLKLSMLLELNIEDFDLLLDERNYSPEK
jgi:hypothetical protein